MEIWKPVRGYEQYYKVSNCGRIRSLDRITIFKDGRQRKFYGKMLNLSTVNNSGYLIIGLHISGKAVTFLVHRLVAEAFLLNSNGCDEVNHIDEDKLNNTADNLEWCTHRENVNHGDEIERGARKQRISFNQLDANGNIIRKFDGFKKAQRECGLDRSAISDCCRGIRKTYLGFRWEYAEVIV